MPIILTLASGRKLLVEGESWKKLDSNAAPYGTIQLKTLPAGDTIGVIKANIETYEEFTEEAWKKRIETIEKAEAEKKAAAELQRKLATNAAWRRSVFHFLHKKPYPEVA